MREGIVFRALDFPAEVHPGDNLARLIGDAVAASDDGLRDGDVLVVAQKVVSKAEGRFVDLAGVTPSPRAAELARETGKDPRQVEVILRESDEVVRAKPGVIVVAHRLGLVMANAGIDRSNIGPGEGDRVLLLPEDPDRSAAHIRDALAARFGTAPGVIVSDSFGRAWRNGVVNVAIGAAGLPTLIDARGRIDRDGRELAVTDIAFADAIAAGAGIAMGEGNESAPVALVRGARADAPHGTAASLIRPVAEDMFR